MKKRLVLLLLLFCMIAALLPIAEAAKTDYEQYLTESFLSETDFTMNGIPICELTYDEAKENVNALVNNLNMEPHESVIDGEKHYFWSQDNYLKVSKIFSNGMVAIGGFPTVRYLQYGVICYHETNATDLAQGMEFVQIESGIRGLTTGDSLELTLGLV